VLRPFATSLALLLLVAGHVSAQDEHALAARLGPETEALLRPTLDAAARDSLPVSALEAKALEGVAKGRPSSQIVAVVKQLADRLRQARSVLAGAEPGMSIAGNEIVTAAEAIASGVSPDDIARLRHDTPPKTSLEIPYAVLGELVRRGVPTGRAREVVGQLVRANVPEARIVGIPARMDVGIRQGTPPEAALGNALHGMGLPVPRSFPHPRGNSQGKGKGRGGGGS